MQNIFADIITIGDEILYGQITDTNSQWISQELDKIGVRVKRKSSVGDSEDEILEVLKEAEQRSEIIIITGGLGPTNDDITKNTLTKYFQTKLVLHEEALMEVTAFFKSRNRELTEINRQQAYLPEACEYVPNKNGTAPAMLFRKGKKVFFSLPGVPFEMKNIITEKIIPIILKEFKTPVIVHKVVKTVGLGESYLADKIKDWESNLPSFIKLAYLPSFSEVKLRLTGSGISKRELQEQIDAEVENLLKIIPEYIFGFDEQLLESVLGNLLTEKNKTLAIAESCTGGFLSHTITSVPGSSKYFLGSLIAYDNAIKINFLGVDKKTLEEFGAVSEETVKQMAEKVREKFNSEIGVATTGIAGPSGGTIEKPVGTIWIACTNGKKTITKKLLYGSLREVNIKLTTLSAINLTRLALLNNFQ